MLKVRFNDFFQLADVGADLFEHGADDATIFAQERSQQVDGFDLRIAGVGRELFLNFRANAGGAEQGAATFGSTLPGPLQTA